MSHYDLKINEAFKKRERLAVYDTIEVAPAFMQPISTVTTCKEATYANTKEHTPPGHKIGAVRSKQKVVTQINEPQQRPFIVTLKRVMIPLIIIGILVIIAGVYLETRWKAARDFSAANWTQLYCTHLVHLPMENRVVVSTRYKKAAPGMVQLTLSRKRLQQHHWFTPQEITTFFTPPPKPYKARERKFINNRRLNDQITSLAWHKNVYNG